MLPRIGNKINPVKDKPPFRASADMSLASRISNGVKSSQYHIFLALCIGLIAFISYNLGRIDALEKFPLKLSEKGVPPAGEGSLGASIYNASEAKSDTPQTKLDTRVVASKNSDKYHYVWCSGAKRISEANKLWFASAQEAENKCYILAGNCEK